MIYLIARRAERRTIASGVPMNPVRPAPISVPDSALDDLRRRLRDSRWPHPLPYAAWEAGAALPAVRELCAYWADGYDWRRAESWFNELQPQFIEVDGLDLHVWHVRGHGRDPAVPLLLLHGWPGSVAEFRHVLGPLTSGGGAGPTFDVVMPSLPGYGFGGKPAEPGWGAARTADALDRLMTESLGYADYGIQGGDWGAVIGARIAARHSEHVRGFHSNMPLFGWQLDDVVVGSEAPTAQHELLRRGRLFALEERGYSQIQGTKPMSVALAQTDSPAGLAAWMLDKFWTWTDHPDDAGIPIERDDLLTNLMFYWAPASVVSSAALYYEARREPAETRPVEVPVGFAAFPREIYPAARDWIERYYPDVRRWTDLPKGGHFAALEQPEVLVEEVRTFFAGL
jgi:microsomal epoxide hydrolase